MRRRLLYLSFTVIFSLLEIVAIFPQGVAFASPAPTEELSYVDAATIHLKMTNATVQYNGHSYTFTFDSNFADKVYLDSTHQYTFGQDSCASTIDTPWLGATSATVTLRQPDSYNGGNCDVEYTYNATIANGDAGKTVAKWVSKNQIRLLQDDGPTPFILGQSTSNPSSFSATIKDDALLGDMCGTLGGLANCSNYCSVSLTMDADKTHGSIQVTDCWGQDLTSLTPPENHIKMLNDRQSPTYQPIIVSASPSHPDQSGTDLAGSIGSSDSTPTLKCSAGYNPLNWLLCGMVQGMVGIISALDGVINSLLSVGSPGNSSDPSQIFGTSDPGGQYSQDNSSQTAESKSYYAAWKSMRNIALGLMVLVGLVIVISQALGTELVDAYTFRKMLPRLLIAAIGISLSWQLMQFFVKFTNELGYGVRYLIYAPFKDLPTTSLQLGGAGGLGIDLLAAGAIGALGIFGLLSFAATGALAVFSAIVILIIRQIIITVLIIAAPIAIVLYVLPNTQKTFKLWHESFSKALLMFPIIAAFVAAGHVFALVAIQGNDNPINQIIGFIAYFAPYFLIPLTLKLAGNALGVIGGAAHARSGGAFAGLKNFRKNQATKNWAKTKSGERFEGINGNKYGRAINRSLQMGTSPGSIIPGRLGAKSRSRLSTNVSSQTAHFAKVLQEAGLQDDTAGNEFIQYGGSLGQLNKRVKDLRATGDERDRETADNLAAYAQFAGSRSARLGAMKLNAGFGKLSDASLESMDSMFGDSAAERAAKSAAFGDLIFTSKNAGNYASYAARIKGGKVQTLSGADAQYRQEIQDNLANSLMDAGPQVYSSIKPYADKDRNGKVNYNTKDVVAQALASNAMTLDGARGDRAMENFAMAELQGAYNDPNMKAALDNAKSMIQADPQALAKYTRAHEAVSRMGTSLDAEGNPTRVVPRNRSQQPPSGGGSLTLPGDDGFNLPPSQQPRG